MMVVFDQYDFVVVVCCRYSGGKVCWFSVDDNYVVIGYYGYGFVLQGYVIDSFVGYGFFFMVLFVFC